MRLRLRAIVLSAAASLALVLATAELFDLSPERAALLAPLIVVTAGAAVGLVLLWTKVAWEELRGRAKTGRAHAERRSGGPGGE